MLSITKTFEFCASHHLCNQNWTNDKNQNEFGKCANIHGHNYRLEVSITGKVNPQTGMIINLSLLDDLVKKEIIQVLDHKNLNVDIAWLKDKIVSLENLLESIWSILDNSISFNYPGVTLEQLILWETSRIYVKRTRN